MDILNLVNEHMKKRENEAQKEEIIKSVTEIKIKYNVPKDVYLYSTKIDKSGKKLKNYNTYFEMWSNHSDKVVMQKVYEYLSLGKYLKEITDLLITEKISKSKFLGKLKKRIKDEGFFYDNNEQKWKRKVETNNISDKASNRIIVETSSLKRNKSLDKNLISKDNVLKDETQSIVNLKPEEIKTLKQIIREWQEKNESETNYELKIRLNKTLFQQLIEYSDAFETSTSKVIDLALNKFFNN
ncbi:hypothetical protein AM500_13030 [Bacillus sp. FJAT-18017]|uniref:hypothetical protein n=1 Tax=Bacillus sp. FJAT-18017 TaxID=1705566 RepID=UPI0006AE2D0C|nr:hypothetical protein [Bacillus sp. FJAT-18017]ALC90606.1 hypothetical protein AM500_13030 [Bacillus sp. FJAT-18017]